MADLRCNLLEILLVPSFLWNELKNGVKTSTSDCLWFIFWDFIQKFMLFRFCSVLIKFNGGVFITFSAAVLRPLDSNTLLCSFNDR